MKHQLNPVVLLAAALLAAMPGIQPAQAGTYANASTEYVNRIKVGETVQPLGAAPFGENISMYTGAVSFLQTDISYPGIGPTITLARSYEASGSPITFGNDLPMADWDLSIPRISTVVAGDRYMGSGGKWKVRLSPSAPVGSISVARCTEFGPIDQSPYGYGLAWWHGYQLITGDGGSQPLLKRTPSNTLAPGNDAARYPVVTAGHWMLSCLPATANGLDGEAFLALAPDGTRYWFDHLAYGAPLEMLIESIPYMNNPDPQPLESLVAGTEEPQTDVYWGYDEQFLPRKTGNLMATRVEDRFGNWLAYSYDDSDRLTEINASDGRKVAIAWRTDAPMVDRITLQPGSPDARTWRYEYANPTNRETRVLTRVIQPDSTSWEFDMRSANHIRLPSASPDNDCNVRTFTQIPSDDNWVTMNIGHPSGLVGSFEMSLRGHARSWTPTVCAQFDGTLSPFTEQVPPVYLSLSLTAKTLVGPGVPEMSWKYRYSPAMGSSKAECLAYGCREWQWVEVTDPDNQTTHYTYSTKWDHTEGKLLSTVAAVAVVGQDAPVGLQTEKVAHADPSLAWPFPTRVGQAMQDPISVSNTAPTETLSPETLSQVSRQGVVFSRRTDSFDRFGQPEKVLRYSTPGESRSDTTLYWPVDSQWVLGQVWKLSQDGQLVSQTDYDGRVQALRTYSFGLLSATYGYHPNGLVSTITDPRLNLTRLDNYHRGVPQRIEFADSSVVAPSADDFGQVKSVRNQLSDSTSYSYDSMGRMTKLVYPTGDTLAWNPVNRNFEPGYTPAFGLPAGHWRQTVQTGNARTTTYYDALWRPRLLLTEDIANPATRSLVVKRYDASGREVFSSYPVSSLVSVDDVLAGVTTHYDGLGRVTSVSQSSELGLLTSTTEYLAPFKTRVTNPRLFQTTTSFQTFDVPTEESPIRIEAPEGATTIIDRDAFGKPKTITREGPAG